MEGSFPENALLPQLSVNRIIKQYASKGNYTSKDAKEGINLAISIFMSYLTATANDVCRKNKRSTILVKDIKQALVLMDFDFIAKEIQEQETPKISNS